MTFNIITIFPDIFSSYLNEGILKKAILKKQIKINIINLRDYSNNPHNKVDDTPYGGGAGMLLRIEPIHLAILDINKKIKTKNKKTILLSANGKKWNQKLAKKYSKLKSITLVCGRYEGVDARVKKIVDEEISIGDYILTGGELAALNIIDSTSRLLNNVLGNKESIIDESHSKEGVLEYPQYTKPQNYTINKKKYSVPKVLLSGNHQKIKDWREKNRKKN